jgi:hypothetical protein
MTLLEIVLPLLVLIAGLAASYRFGQSRADCCEGHDWQPQHFKHGGDQRARLMLDAVWVEKEAAFKCDLCGERKTDWLCTRRMKTQQIPHSKNVELGLADNIRVK